MHMACSTNDSAHAAILWALTVQDNVGMHARVRMKHGEEGAKCHVSISPVLLADFALNVLYVSDFSDRVITPLHQQPTPQHSIKMASSSPIVISLGNPLVSCFLHHSEAHSSRSSSTSRSTPSTARSTSKSTASTRTMPFSPRRSTCLCEYGSRLARSFRR